MSPSSGETSAQCIELVPVSGHQHQKSKVKSKLCYDWRSVDQSVLVSGTHLGPATNASPSLFSYLLDSYGLVADGRPFWRKVECVVFSLCSASPAQSFSGLSPTGLTGTFHCLHFWDSPNLEGQVPVFISPKNKGAQLYPSGTGHQHWSRRRNYFTTNGQSVSQYVLVASPLWDLWTVGTLLSESCGLLYVGAPSVTRGRVCNLRCNHSMVRVAQNP
jgi:hypothetical protein